MSKSKDPLVIRMFSDYLKPYTLLLLVAIFFMMITAAATAGFAHMLETVLDEVLYGKREELILPVALFFLGIFIVRGVSNYIYAILMNKIGQSIVADIQNDLFARFMSLDLVFFHTNPSGQLLSRIVNDVNVMRAAISDTLTGFGKSFLTLVFLIAVMFSKDAMLSIAAFTIFPIAAAFVVFIGKKIRKVSGNIQNNLGFLSDRLSQIFQGIRLVKAYGMEEYEKERAGELIEKVKTLTMKSVRFGQMSTPVNDALVGIAVFVIILYGGHQVVGGQTSPGALISFIAAFTLAYEPMKKLASLNNILQLGLGAADRVYEMLDTESEIKEVENPQKISDPKGDITLSNVFFEYSGKDVAALSNVSCIIESGKITALVGASGGGKTTMMNLIPRFYDVKEGSVKIGNQDVRDLSLLDLRKNISLVSQDITIFDDTIEANIRYGQLDASSDEVINVAKQAEAHDFISAFPEGYNTKVGEDGVLLSGGQRQRIAIARAILRNAPILLLDEATSALDNESEKAIQDSLSKLQKGKTTLVIAHRLSTIQHADKILVLKDGNIVETGTHSDLLAKEGIYAELYRSGKK